MEVGEYSRKMSARGHGDWTFVTGHLLDGAIALAQMPEEIRVRPDDVCARIWCSTCACTSAPRCEATGWRKSSFRARWTTGSGAVRFPNPPTATLTTLPRTAPARFWTPGSISLSGKKAPSLTEPSKLNSSIPAFMPLTSRLVKNFEERSSRPLWLIAGKQMRWRDPGGSREHQRNP
jgi:hypothetical protein